MAVGRGQEFNSFYSLLPVVQIPSAKLIGTHRSSSCEGKKENARDGGALVFCPADLPSSTFQGIHVPI